MTRVRIAVAVSEDGHWAAYGESGTEDTFKQACALESLEGGGGYELLFVEADIPVPEPYVPPTVEGTVTD